MTAAAAPELDLAFQGPGGDDQEAFWLAHLGAWLGQLAPELPPELRAAGYSLGLELCDDAAIAELNRTWRQREGPTDVLAFAAQEGAPPPPPDAADTWLELGDIVISMETARRQAAAADHSLEAELLFLASHGLLHLLGWDHPDETSLAAMLARQTELLQAAGP